jgi:cytosine deaminase
MDNLKTIQELEEKILKFNPSGKHDVFALEAVKEAINAAKSGNFGVGAVLVNNETDEIMYRGRNKVFSESRSDMHAEMDLFNNFETQHKNKSREMIKNYSLYTSLESCPMCMCRIITAGVTEVYHLADDLGGGMVHLKNQLPPVWQKISKSRIFKKAQCSGELSEIAAQVFFLTDDLNKKLIN